MLVRSTFPHPFPITVSCQAAQQLQSDSPGSILTVGGRALAKHHHRDGTRSWWGDGGSGTNVEKNQRAVDALTRILRGATWSNVHALPAPDGSGSSLSVFETREALGHGARGELRHDDGSGGGGRSSSSSPSACVFRGFLEPQMKDGHLLKWRH